MISGLASKCPLFCMGLQSKLGVSSKYLRVVVVMMVVEMVMHGGGGDGDGGGYDDYKKEEVKDNDADYNYSENN